MKERLEEFYSDQRGNLPLPELVGMAIGGIVGFLALPAADWFFASSDWPDYFKYVLRRAAQSVEIKIGVGVFGAAAGLLIGNFQRQEKIREQQERAFLGGERGSVRVAAALAVGLAALGIGTGAAAAHLAEPTMNVVHQLSAQIGEAISRAPVISPRVDY